MSKDNAYLEDMLEAAKAIQRFTTGVSREAFKANEEKYEAVNRWTALAAPRMSAR